MLKVALFNEPGKRKESEDNVLELRVNETVHVLAIADGVGGEKNGKIASKIALVIVEKYFNKNMKYNLSEIFSEVKKSMESMALENSELQTMATTLTICVVENNRCSLGHVGDTRLYHLRDTSLQTHSKDQTELQALLDAGILSKRRARRYHRKNILLSAMSPSCSYEVQYLDFNLEEGDRLILLSDGVYNVLNKKQIRDISLDSPTVGELAEKMKYQVISEGIVDDFSAAAAEYRLH